MSPVSPGTGPSALLERWRTDIAALAPSADAARCAAEGEALARGWSEPHRRYHTLDHLAEMFAVLAELESVGALAPAEARVARIAGWYHDLVYDPRAEPGDNERGSAGIATDRLRGLGVAGPAVELIESLILLTLDHQGFPAGPAGGTAARAAFHDADLWILAAPADRFDEYCAQVREEFAHVPDPLYAAARGDILRSLVGRGPIYRTAHGAGAWQDAAEANVARELARLGTG
ncbi:hypothetical protein GCM10009583_26640 [Ornithinicoccus hortensis]|uniref:Putative metal-dependent HD superfamily phosphohydrolase n=1 Tax=Ornithinicoccus hortensis TaxID=82346 RepID=A0A542YP48_9MICO|nr:putative metal-dependent HD superfamily phosphohydrolase [Ornithinicoccus hortensis]